MFSTWRPNILFKMPKLAQSKFPIRKFLKTKEKDYFLKHNYRAHFFSSFVKKIKVPKVKIFL